MSWLKSVEIKIGDNKTIYEMVDGISKGVKVEYYYKNEIIIEKPFHNGVDTINTFTNTNRTPIIMPENEK
jgi:hypothetical protein